MELTAFLFADVRISWTPPFGVCTRENLDGYIARDHRAFNMRDGSVIVLCRVDELKCAPTPAPVDHDPRSEQKRPQVAGAFEERKNEESSAPSQTSAFWAKKLHISFVVHNPGRQLLSGSFHPVDDDKV